MQDEARDAASIRVVLVEDCPEDAELNLAELEQAGLVVSALRVDDESGLREALERFRPDIVLSDLSLPGFDGYAALRLVRERGPGLPFIFVSGTMGEDAAVEALRQGAADYILKHNMMRLAAAVRRALHEARLEMERRQAHHELLRAQRMESLALTCGGLGHDLRNVLQPLLVVPSLLEERKGEPGLESIAELVRDCAARGLDIVNSMLSFARGDSPPGEQVEVDELFDSLALLAGSQLGPGIALAFAGRDEGLVVPCSRTGIQQVLLNLVLNSAQAMPDGGELEVGASTGADETVVLHVQDSGTGMSDEVKAQLFTPFFTTRSGGTGLGLYSCRSIVEQHGGWLTVESSPGAGTRVELHFPLLPEDTGTWTLPASAQRPRILIVDERPGRPVRLARGLEAAGFSCHVANDGASALHQLYAGSPPDAVVITLQACLLSPVQPLDLLARQSPGCPVVVLVPPGHDADAAAWPAGLTVHSLPSDADVRTLRTLLRDLAGAGPPPS